MSFTQEEIFFNDFKVIFSNKEFLDSVGGDKKANIIPSSITINELEEYHEIALKCLIEHLKTTNNKDILNEMFIGDFINADIYFLMNLKDISLSFMEQYRFDNCIENDDEKFSIAMLKLSTFLRSLFGLHTTFMRQTEE